MRITVIGLDVHLLPQASRLRIEDPDNALCIYLRTGSASFRIDAPGMAPVTVTEGTAIGFEDGRPHDWQAGTAGSAELIVVRIPRAMAVMHGMDNGYMILPPDRQPFATSLRHSIEMLMIEHQYSFATEDSAVAARCIEIGMIQFVRYANARMSEQANLPAAVAHDTYLLRAMAAFYREPQRRWSVDELARASGLGRTAFNAHFRKIIGSAPIKTVNTIRLRQAAATLKQSKAPLSEIAFNSGFSSEAAFVRAFKRLFGTTPGRYRTEALATSPE